MDQKTRLKKLNELLAQKLATFEQTPVFANSISESELDEVAYNYIIYTTGDFERPSEPSDDYTMNQTVYVTWVSENRGFIDGDVLELAKLIKLARHDLVRITKEHQQLANQDRYLDIVVFECTRLIKVDCYG